MDLMMDAEQGPRDPCNLNGVGRPPRLIFYSEGGRGAAEAAPTRRTSSGANFRQDLRVGSSNILTLS